MNNDVMPRAAGHTSAPTDLWRFASIAVVGGGSLLALSTIIEPGGPFILAAVYLTLALPALLLTRREQGDDGARRLLRSCLHLPRHGWWLPAAGLALPIASWAVAAPLGGARDVTGSSVVAYVLDLVVGVALVNLWEELAWAGYFQRRAVGRWGPTTGSLITAAFFTAIHLPLALQGVGSVSEAGTNLAILGGVAIGVRLVIAHLDRWTSSLLVIGLFHSSFNATEDVLESSVDWIRVALVMAAGVVLAAFAPRRPPVAAGTGSTPRSAGSSPAGVRGKSAG